MTVQTLMYDNLVDSQVIAIDNNAITAKWLCIDVTIKSRDIAVGSANFKPLFPRIWSGHWYLLKNQSIVSEGVLEYERQRIYELELTRYHDAVNFGLAGQIGYLSSIDGPLNPFDEPTGLYAEGLTRYLVEHNQIGECNSLPAHKIGSVGIYVPVGVVYSVKIQYEPWCGLLTDLDNDGTLEVTNTTGQPIPEQPNLILNQTDFSTQTFDDVALAKGYVKLDDIQTACNSAGYLSEDQWGQLSGIIKRGSYYFRWQNQFDRSGTFTLAGLKSFAGVLTGTWGQYSPIVLNPMNLGSNPSYTYIYLRWSIVGNRYVYVLADQYVTTAGYSLTNLSTQVVAV